MSESFEGRKVVVVGGSSGMGLATAHQVVAWGGTAVITGRDRTRSRPRLTPCRRTESGRAVDFVVVSDRAQLGEIA